MLMQRLWKEKMNWDEPIPDDQLRIWSRLRSELCDISVLRIERGLKMNGATVFELHGFADASTVAYGCCIYLRSVTGDGGVSVRLMCAKSKVAPIKEQQRVVEPAADAVEMTVPRLELCAALLLAEQINKVREVLATKPTRVVLWTDSRIVLCWLKRMNSKITVFVRNRVNKIRHLSMNVEWCHVSTKMNPADLVSRGLFPNELMNCDLWWTGPAYLHSNKYEINADVVDPNESDECVPEQVMSVTVLGNSVYDTVIAVSSFRKLQRIFGYIIRLLYNCRARQRNQSRRDGWLTSVEHRDALYAMVYVVQWHEFYEDISRLQKQQPVSKMLRNLNPIYDDDERLLRVGGRIKHSNLPKDQKHPMILPANHHFTNILVETLHREHLHVGLDGLLAVVKQRFWPIHAKRTIHRVLRKCITCFRARPRDVVQYMGDLPSFRVIAAEPFARTGVDYAWPFLLKVGRSRTKLKSYVSLFVCMVTKAVHLELVTSLSADGFLAALHRFAGRRGNPSEIFSDNGTNFRGANRQLTELAELLKSQVLEQRVGEFCQPRGISWKFNPPRAPHQGGLWEANVKCMKTHLYKVLNESYLSYEEMNTLLIQVEAILNSRPLVQLTDDPVDYEALSPGHFLIGRELTAVAEPIYEHLKESSLSRYQMVQKRKQCFWRRWSNEYLTSLQRRSKWYKNPTLLRKGLLVILKEDNMPSQTWRMGRIVETFPGKDGITRVVEVRTSNGIYRRPTTQIAVLPVNDELQNVKDEQS
ncbi:uncharacterized protein LOC131433973 [Malaya genurostris]|uniref:uncharacterized protein LOC131433973 n=1 Tax=Malaya genurostris TaxID=325434 RepID=UPI0026F3D817|nr:uncharacterized protein LOC131433973 [Malaya genurostris]